jgi:prepilin-type N-terminal cleavage/methylation domain-containing protein
MSAVRHRRGRSRAGERRGFTVVELLVAVSVLTLIVVVLYKIFDQTQKAMRSNSAQVDVSEGGRAAMELIARDFEQMTVAPVAGSLNFYVGLPGTPFIQPLVPPTQLRTNFLQELFFLSEFNQKPSGIGYRVVPYTNSLGNPFPASVGMLCRFEYDTNRAAVNGNSNLLLKTFLANANRSHPDLFQRVTDGIVHFRITAYDALGLPMNEPTPTRGRPELRYALLSTNIVLSGNFATTTATNITFVGVGVTNYSRQTGYFFTNVVPPFVEVELGILEPQTLDRWKSMPNALMASNFLARQAGKITLFRQRVPVRSAAPIVPFLIP